MSIQNHSITIESVEFEFHRKRLVLYVIAMPLDGFSHFIVGVDNKTDALNDIKIGFFTHRLYCRNEFAGIAFGYQLRRKRGF
jgi:hypothetical protein